MIFPGFPPQKRNDESEFKPETLINKGKHESSKLNLIANDISITSNLSEEEDEKFNKIVLDRPVVKNKKKQKLKKTVISDPVADKEEKRSSMDKTMLLKDSRKTENELLIDIKIIEEKKTETSKMSEKEPASQITELIDNKIKNDSIIPKHQGKYFLFYLLNIIIRRNQNRQ